MCMCERERVALDIPLDTIVVVGESVCEREGVYVGESVCV